MAFIVNMLLTCIQKNCDAGLVCDLNCLQVPGGVSHMKQTGMLVVSLRGVSFGFWSRSNSVCFGIFSVTTLLAIGREGSKRSV